MLTLYYAPGAVSFAPHFLLNECDLPHRTRRLSTADDEHLGAAYLRVNPLGQVPALELGDGAVLTQVGAILQYLASLVPDAQLVPGDALGRARCQELLSMLSTSLHHAFTMLSRPDRLVPDEAAHAPMREAGRGLAGKLFSYLDGRLTDTWAAGPRFSVADPHLLVYTMWARYFEVDIRACENLREWSARMFERPAFRATLLAEGLIDAQGRRTPPSRV